MEFVAKQKTQERKTIRSVDKAIDDGAFILERIDPGTTGCVIALVLREQPLGVSG